jgi:hypothetical protein
MGRRGEGLLHRVFLEYTRENFEATRQWTQAHDLFSGPPPAGYDQAALV